jgi:hypothetical protein
MFRRFPKWTFCKKRKPDSDGRYLVYVVEKDCLWERIVTATYYHMNDSWYLDDYKNSEVVAWIETPLTPYGMRLTQ